MSSLRPALSPRPALPRSSWPLFLLLALGLGPAGCLVGGQTASAPAQRDDRLLAELRQQERWAGEAAAGRASREELKAARDGDVDAQADLRQRFRKLVRAAERATWVREATNAALQGRTDAEKTQLVASFDKAARLRKEAWDAADEIAQTLCAIEGPAPLALADLRRGLATVRAAAQSEKRIARLAPIALTTEAATPAAGRAKPEDGKGGSTQAPARAAELRLAAAPPPSPKPFVEAAALLLDKHPAEEDGLRSFKPELAEEATQIKAALSDLRAQRPPETASLEAEGKALAPDAADAPGAAAPDSAAPDSAASGATGASSGAESGAKAVEEARPPGGAPAAVDRTIELKGEARALLRRRGPPRAIVARPDGSFVLRYDGPPRCATPPCPLADFRFDAAGERLRDAPEAPGRAPAPAQPPADR